MASEREQAKGAIQGRSKEDPELDSALSDAHTLQLSLTKENNRHKEQMRGIDLGHIGRWIGGEKSAPITVALILAFFGVLVAGGCWIAAAQNPESQEFWAKQAERGLAVATGAVAFIFGRSR